VDEGIPSNTLKKHELKDNIDYYSIMDLPDDEEASYG